MASQRLLNLVKTSYGIQDGIFALHANDRQSAKEAMKLAKVENLSRQEFVQLHIDHLTGMLCTPEHYVEQMREIERFTSKYNSL